MTIVIESKVQPHKHVHYYTMLIACIALLPNIAIESLSPAIPAMAEHYLTSIDHIQLSFSMLTAFLCLSAIFWGILSMQYGRKTSLLCGIGLAAFAYLSANTTTTLGQLFICQTIAGLGLGVTTLFRGLKRDLFQGIMLRKVAANSALIITQASAGAPLVGGIILSQFGIHALFYFLLCSCVAVWCFILYSKLPQPKDQPSLRDIIEHLRVNVSKKFLRISLCNLLAMCGYLSWYLTLPILIIKQLAWSPQSYGLVFLCVTSSAQFIGAIANSILIHHFSEHKLLYWTWSFMIICGISMFLCHQIYGIQAWWLFLHLWLYFLTSLFIWPNVMTAAFDNMTLDPGLASTLFGLLQACGAFLATLLCANMPLSVCNDLIVILVFANGFSIGFYHLAHKI